MIREAFRYFDSGPKSTEFALWVIGIALLILIVFIYFWWTRLVRPYLYIKTPKK